MMQNNNINIPDTTLFSFCWGSQYFEATLKSFLLSNSLVNFKQKIIATDVDNIDIAKYNDLLNDNNIKIVQTNITLNNNLKNDDQNRSRFSTEFLNLMSDICETNFLLNIQYDSAIINPELWTDDFLQYDYIGAPWPIEIIQASDMVAGKIPVIKNIVGNGGFSLRSKKYMEESKKLELHHKNEDLNICVFYFDHMIAKGIRFATPDIAIKFSVEHPIKNLNMFDRNFLMTYKSFGFHGAFNRAGMNYIENYAGVKI
jgi:hypothetical protein